ncbi:MAG TPA: hypothetical protein VFG68_09820 [Fimbriiglobus sp.]|nr:hypothetical protein [Fimbriiglobus sp.]
MHGLMRRLLGGAAVLALAAGCSSEPPMAQVSGTVTFKGQPVPAGWISFTPDANKGTVRVCQIKDGVYDSSKEGQPGVYPGKNLVKIAGFDGNKVPLWGQGKQIFNPVDDTFNVPSGTTTKDWVVPESAGKNVKIQPTADE